MSNKKNALIDATIRLVAEGGVGAATIRAIARQVGVTEAAVYRHFRNKGELYDRAYARIVEEMIDEKRHLVAGAAAIRDKLREWVRLSYAYFDRHPEAFTYVLLTPRIVADPERAGARQREMFVDMMRAALDAGEIRPIAPQIAASHFAGMMLNVPRLIHAGELEGPALSYLDDVADAVWRVFSPET